MPTCKVLQLGFVGEKHPVSVPSCSLSASLLPSQKSLDSPGCLLAGRLLVGCELGRSSCFQLAGLGAAGS